MILIVQDNKIETDDIINISEVKVIDDHIECCVRFVIKNKFGINIVISESGNSNYISHKMINLRDKIHGIWLGDLIPYAI